KLRAWASIKLEQLSPHKGHSPPSSQKGIETLESVQDALLALTPKDERQKHLRTICLTLSSNLIYERWSLEQHAGHSIPVPVLVSFVAIFGGALGGIFAASRLPGPHLSGQTQSAITVSFAVIGTLAALVLGLMVTAANHSFSARTDEVRELSLQVVRIDRNLR